MDPGDHSEPSQGPAEDPACDASATAGEGPGPRTDSFHERLSAAYDRVPFIGERWTRWYDLPYKFLSFLQTNWRRKVLPYPMRRGLQRASFNLSQFNELDRNKAWDRDDPLRNFQVPHGEHVAMPAIWVVEMFPPSTLSRLERAIDRNGWDRDQSISGRQDTNANMLAKSRARAGWRWWRMASIQDAKGTRFAPESVRVRLPPEFSFIELKAIQLGSSLTAVTAHFHLSDMGASLLDGAWRGPHEPRMLRRNGGTQVLDRMWAGFHVTQSARERLHRLARDWMKDNCDGLFAELDSPQTLIDMLLLDQYDPTEPREELGRDLFDVLRALGITETGMRRVRSGDIPGMLLSRTDPTMAGGMSTHRTWAMWGQRHSVVSSAKYMGAYGGSVDQAVAHRYSEAVESFLVTLAVSDLLESVEARYATIRDRARGQHGHFRASVVKQLREQLLTLSIDVATIQRDLVKFWSTWSALVGEPKFTLEYAAELRKGTDRYDPVDLNKQTRELQRERIEDLAAADRDYREILSTVASLGASVDASRTSRRALWIAVVSLLVAVATVALTVIGDDAMIQDLLKLIRDAY